MAIKLLAPGGLLLTVAHWLRGHDILTGIALSVLFIALLAKLLFALVLPRHGGGLPPSGDFPDTGNEPVMRPPGGAPPRLSAAKEVPQSQAVS